MTHEEMEKEVLEISAFLKIISHLDNCDIDILDLQTVASVFASKADILYCSICDDLSWKEKA